MSSRELMRAARRFADQQSSTVGALAFSRQILSTVTAVTPGAASDGNARITVTWRGSEITAAGYANTYTPVVGDRVVCDVIDNQLIVAFRVIGSP